METIYNGLVIIMDSQTADLIRGTYTNKGLNPLPCENVFYLSQSILMDRTFNSIFSILSELPIKLLAIETVFDPNTRELTAIKTLTDPE
jgi:hypothetical protein